MKKSNHEAINLLLDLRTKTGYHFSIKDGSLSTDKDFTLFQIISTQQTLESLNLTDQETQNAKLILEWLIDCVKVKKNKLRTLHGKLDHILKFLFLFPREDLMRVLTDSPQEKLIPSGLDQSKQGKYFSILRSFYRYNSNEKLPVTLNYKQKKELLQRHLLMPKDIEEIINFVIDKTRETIQDPETKISVTDYLIVFFLICIFTGLRRKEILQLKLCDIDITDRITVSVIGKMDKRRSTEINRDLVNIPEFIIKYLRFFYLQRKNETNGDFSSPVFIGKIFTDTSNLNLVSLDTTAQKIHRLIEDDNHYNGLHGLRRYFANQLRAQKVSLLNIILSLGQSTTSTAPENYLQIFPILQREQFYDWTEKQNYLTFPNEIAIFNFSRNQNTSVEGIYKILNKTNNKNKYNARPKKITINDAIALLAHRIKEIQKNK